MKYSCTLYTQKTENNQTYQPVPNTSIALSSYKLLSGRVALVQKSKITQNYRP